MSMPVWAPSARDYGRAMSAGRAARGNVHSDGAPECIYVDRCHHKTRGAALMDSIWARASSGTLRGALMLDAAWRLHRARYADSSAVAAYELERAADARRELVRLDHEVFVTDPEDGTSYCDCGAVMARDYRYAVGAWHAHLREVGAE